MNNQIDFYFDFISPYAFLAHKRIRKIEKQMNIKINYKPILLGGLHNLSGITAPAFINSKAKYMIKDCKLWAEKYGISFRFNNYFPINTLNLMRCVLIAEKKKFSSVFINKIFDSIWKDGLNLNDSIIIEKLLKNLDLNPKAFLVEATEAKNKDELKKRTNDAIKKGIFGAPSFIINNKMFWGQDRLEFVLYEAKK